MFIGRFVAPFVLLAVAPATFAAPCPDVVGPVGGLKPGAELFGLEGPLSEIDTANRTVTVIGQCVNMPAGILVDNDGDGVGDIPFEDLVTNGGRSPLGGTMIIDGNVTIDANGFVDFTATLPYFDFGENVIVGPLVSVAADNQSFTVGGTKVVVNTDNRLPKNLFDLNFNQIQISELRGWEGTVVGAEGYFQNGVLNATITETEVIPAVAGVDSVATERAQFRTSKGSVDIRGQVTKQDGTLATFADEVYIDIGCNSRDGAGKPILPGNPGASIENTAVVTVDPVLNLGDWRWTSGNNAATGITTATTVCVYSELGGQSEPRNFTVRN